MVRLEQGSERGAAVLDADTSSVREPRNAAENKTVLVRHRQHGDPDESRCVWLHPDR